MKESKTETRQLKVVIINKSDSTGGAAVVSRRLMEALRREGVDARMLVVEKLSDSPYVEPAASPSAIKRCFLKERLKIFVSNGFNRKTLFKIDTASEGLPLWDHPLVKDADAILLNWVNQGMLSLKGIKKILVTGKPVVWTMHDMWCMTGVCHHAATCNGFLDRCGNCPLLGRLRSPEDLSHKTWLKKNNLYNSPNQILYVAVSHWLAAKAMESSLLCGRDVTVIPNAFPLSENTRHNSLNNNRIRILFGAARLDDPIKGLPVLIEASHILHNEYPEIADKMEIVTFGDVKNPDSLKGFGVSHRHLGIIKGEDMVRHTYENADILVSASSYETLPGTLVEAQAYGCIPISFNQGGQADITDHLHTGYIAEYSDDIKVAAGNLAKGIIWAASVIQDSNAVREIRQRMRDNVMKKFSQKSVAQAYIDLITSK